jgi:Subtilase family
VIKALAAVRFLDLAVGSRIALGWIFLACVMPSQNAYAANETQPHIAFVTPNHSLADLEGSMANYYKQLKNSNRLPVQVVTDDLGTSVQTLVFGMGLLRGSLDKPSFPASMDQLLCSLNQKVCSVRDDRPIWTNKKGDRICLPDVHWVNGVHFARIAPPKGGILVDQLEREFGTCTVIGAECAEATKALNKAHGSDGTVEAVVLAQAAEAPLKNEQPPTDCERAVSLPASSKLTTVGSIYLKRFGVSTPSSSLGLRPNVIEHANIYREQSTRTPPQPSESSDSDGRSEFRIARDVAKSKERVSSVESKPKMSLRPQKRETVGSNDLLASLAATRASSAAPELTPIPPVPVAVSVTVPDAIDNDVFKKANLIRFGTAPAPYRPVAVLVFDWEVNRCHLVLKKPLNATECPPASYTTFQIMPTPKDPDHGDHIAALISGGYGVGVSPYASLIPVTILGAEVTRFTYNIYQTISQSLLKATADTRVANFSVDLRPESARVTDMIGRMVDGRRGMLFVAAAGDAPGSLDAACDIEPACSRPMQPLGNNLIVVGGASLKGDVWAIWPKSRYGLRVDILAPAEEVESAMHEDRMLGRMTGSSQSAALVSGLAARLYEGPPPPGVDDWGGAAVKNRLLATARFFPSLRPYTRSGIVDADRALDTTDQVLVVERDGARAEYHGQLLGVALSGPTPSNSTELPFEVPGSTTIDICRVYRLTRFGKSDWTVAYQPISQSAAGRWSQMELAPGARLHASTKLLEFQPSGEASIFVPIGDVVDFYDKFSEDLACRPNTKSG